MTELTKKYKEKLKKAIEKQRQRLEKKVSFIVIISIYYFTIYK